MSEINYGLCFGANALFFMSASFICITLMHRITLPSAVLIDLLLIVSTIKLMNGKRC